MNAISKTFKRDIQLYLKEQGNTLRPIVFYVMIVSVFPMTLSLNTKILSNLAPAILWISALLTILISIEKVIKDDFEDGSIEQLFLSPQSVAILLLIKLTAHWLIFLVPILLITPLLAISLHFPNSGWIGLLLSLMIGLPTLSLVAALSLSLVVGLREGSVLLSIIGLPLMMPVVLLGISASQSASVNLPFSAEISLLLALFLFCILAVPCVMRYALKIRLAA